MPTMNEYRRCSHISAIIVVVALQALLLLACGTNETPAVATESAIGRTTVPGPADPDATATIAATATLTSSTTPTATETTSGSGSVAVAVDAAAAIASRTPIPTATPSKIDRKIVQVTDSLGLAGMTFLGLTSDDWVNLGISILIILAGYFLGARLLTSALKWVVRRTSMKADDALVGRIGPEITWLSVLFFTRIAVNRLDFLPDRMRTTLDDITFTAGLVIVTMTAVKIIGFAAQRYQDQLRSKNDEPDVEKLDPVILAVERVAELFVLILAASIGLSHFGIGISAMAAMILVVGFAITFGAQNVISDALSGFIILVDQPFRIGDSVLLKEPDTWGDVLQIGARTTRILTLDNREVIVPNSRVSESQVVNYSYPDSTYRVESQIRIAYDSDLDKAREVISSALRGVDGVLTDKPVQVFFLEYGDSAYHLSVRWWIENYTSEYEMLDKGNSVIKDSLKQAGIVIPFNTYELNLNRDSEPSRDDANSSRKVG